MNYGNYILFKQCTIGLNTQVKYLGSSVPEEHVLEGVVVDRPQHEGEEVLGVRLAKICHQS